ncbi:ABC transporter permease [Pimelobacter simplex]|uniref:ABC transporter permease n=1 Tax=Nocardioides simplex TaxID=2045 RepID=UPI0036736361
MSHGHRATETARLLTDAAASLLLRPGHTLGMISGILLGVASAVGAVTIADTQQAQIDLRFDLQRSGIVALEATTPTKAGFPADGIARVAALDPVAAVGELSRWNDRATVAQPGGEDGLLAPVLVGDRGGLDATGTTVVAGAPAAALDDPAATGTAWLGERLAARLGLTDPAAGTATVVVDGVPFTVVGTVRNGGSFGYVSGAVLLSRPSAVAGLRTTGSNVRVMAKVRPGSAAVVADYMLAAVDPTRRLTLENVTPPDGEILLGNVGGDLRRVGAALGGFIGLVGMITVANTLSLSVYQRRRELGLRSAMGWSRRRIGLLVLSESGLAGAVAGVLGSALGVAAAALWCRLHDWELVMARELPLLVVGGAVLASLAGGLLPAVRAASTSPLAAMRS